MGATRFDADSNQNPCRCRYSNNDFITLLRLYPFTSKVVSLHLSSKLFYVGTCDLPRSSLCAAEHSCRFGLLFPDFILTSQSVDDVVVCVLVVDGTEYVVTMERKRNFTSPCCDLWQAQYTHGRVSLHSIVMVAYLRRSRRPALFCGRECLRMHPSISIALSIWFDVQEGRNMHVKLTQTLTPFIVTSSSPSHNRSDG